MIPAEAVSDWMVVSQEQILLFADATGDRQWLHVDRARAATESPYGTTIAHGFLTLSLLSTMLRQAVTIEGTSMAVNYGLDRVRFTAPVIAGSRIRAHFVAGSVEEKRGLTRVVWNVTVESEAAGKPCCIADWIVLYYR